MMELPTAARELSRSELIELWHQALKEWAAAQRVEAELWAEIELRGIDTSPRAVRAWRRSP